MFSINQNYVKPLQIIWSKCGERWDKKNSIHVDDLARNFERNPECGVTISPFYLKGLCLSFCLSAYLPAFASIQTVSASVTQCLSLCQYVSLSISHIGRAKV